MTSTQAPETTIPDGVTITYRSPLIDSKYDHSVYYDGQVMVVTGPNGSISIEARGETRLSDGDTTWTDADALRRDFPDGNAGDLDDTDAPNGNTYTYHLQNWFDLYDVPEDEDDEWFGRDYAMSSLNEAIAEACQIVSQPDVGA